MCYEHPPIASLLTGAIQESDLVSPGLNGYALRECHLMMMMMISSRCEALCTKLITKEMNSVEFSCTYISLCLLVIVLKVRCC